MRIGVLAPPWVSVPPPRYGGVETVVDSLAVGYQAAGHDVRLRRRPARFRPAG